MWTGGMYGGGRSWAVTAACGVLLMSLSACASSPREGHRRPRGTASSGRAARPPAPAPMGRVGVFTLSDAGGVLPDPGTRLPYDQGRSYEVPENWGEAHRRDFYYVIAIDYNRVRGTPPNDPNRPLGQRKGGGIWLHLDHGDGTAACVTLPASGMEYLLRTLDPDRRPVVVMGDRARLMG
ncbi:hypothetical protein ACIPW1_09210 [Streptomyces nodosus]|uniref:hypothetical protein n=1 Tax=Streptomyces nodosus TaxID=40318 RepID=UPI00382BD5B0